MNPVDSHIHWFPHAFYEFLSKRSEEPRTVRKGNTWDYEFGNRSVAMWPEWFDLDMQWETQAKTGMEMTLVTSMGVHSDLEGLPADEAREAARIVNEEWSAKQRQHPGRFFGIAGVPLVDTQMAIDELDHAITKLDLRGVSIPGSIDGDGLDAPRLEDFWARVEELGVPMFIHPTDGAFLDHLGDRNIHLSIGRMVDSSVGVLRLILSGVLDRHPDLKIVHFHCGGVLPYTTGRLDKNIRSQTLTAKPSEYVKRLWVDTAQPHTLTIDMARRYYGADRVFYGSDNPCWNPMAALEACNALDLTEEERVALLDTNVRDVVDMRAPVTA
jgi:aminocarboxymuconate-semialdehyde decarboxylase